MALESSSRRLEKNLNPATPVAGEAPVAEERMDFDQTIRDSQRGKSFALYIEHVPSKDRLIAALAKYKKGVHTESELARLQAAFEMFEKKEGSAEHSFKTIEDWQEDILENSAVFTRFTKFQNLDKIKRVLEKGLPDLALKDPRTFKAVQDEIGKLNAFVARDGVATELIKKFCEKHGITEDDAVLDALRHLSPSDRQNAVRDVLKKHIRQRDGFWGLFTRTKGEAQELSSKVNLGQLINERKQVSKDFGDYLRVFLVTNKEFRTALSRAHDESQPAFENGSESKLSFTEAQTENEQLSKEGSFRRAKEYRESHKVLFREAKRLQASKNAADVTKGDKMISDAQDDFYAQEKNRQLKFEKKGGAFARVFIAVIGALFNVKADPDIKKELS